MGKVTVRIHFLRTDDSFNLKVRTLHAWEEDPTYQARNTKCEKLRQHLISVYIKAKVDLLRRIKKSKVSLNICESPYNINVQYILYT